MDAKTKAKADELLETFWSESGGGELLALRADAISDGDNLSEFLKLQSQPNDGLRQYAHAA